MIDDTKNRCEWCGVEGHCLKDCSHLRAYGRMIAPQHFPPSLPAVATVPIGLPTDSDARKDVPLARGVLDYFPAALVEVARLSKVANDKHNPGEDLHWARGKSMDHADCLLRHLVERGTKDDDGISHTVKVAWRALALLQEELERGGAPQARGAR